MKLIGSIQLTIAALACMIASSVASPLYDYVHRNDGFFSWNDTGIRLDKQQGWTGYLLNVTSQKWMTEQDSNHPIWTHQMLIVIPDNLKTGGNFNNTGCLYMTGGHNGNPGVPDPTSEDVLFASLMATRTGSICATLWQVPNEPIVFWSDPQRRERSEDAAIAWTWKEYMDYGPYHNTPEFILEFPMTKAGVKALDAMQQWVYLHRGRMLEKFVVAGASKRGWTTWLVGAVDNRVVGIAPIVMDLLNLAKNLPHMYRAYGGWSFALRDYYQANVTAHINTPSFARLAKQIDPFEMKENLTMPKLVIDATGDEFFMPDDDYYWWGQLPGESLRLMIQNAEHSMATGLFELVPGIEAWYSALLLDSPRPSFTWTIEQGTGAINIVSKTPPSKVVMNFATTYGAKRRDFRLVKGDTPADPCKFIKVHIFGNACINPVLWTGESIAPQQVEYDRNGSPVLYKYRLTQPLPAEGWRGFFGQLFFPGPAGTVYQLTTQVSIIPQTFPFPSCQGTGCIGQLV